MSGLEQAGEHRAAALVARRSLVDRVRRVWRWKVAVAVDRCLPNQCWANVCDFPLGNSRTPVAFRDGICKGDEARNGSCWCGKYPKEKRNV